MFDDVCDFVSGVPNISKSFLSHLQSDEFRFLFPGVVVILLFSYTTVV